MEIKELEAEQITLSLSNESLQKARELDADFITDTQNTLQACIDGKTAIANKFEAINRKYDNVKTEQIKQGEVLNEKMRKELRHDLMRPLPSPIINNNDRMQ